MFRFKKNERGAVSLEACIVLPIFIFVLMFFYGLMVFFSGHQLLSHSLIQSAESLSLDPYATEQLKISWDEMEGGEDLVQAMYADACPGERGKGAGLLLLFYLQRAGQGPCF